jgi:hypothetical protein
MTKKWLKSFPALLDRPLKFVAQSETRKVGGRVDVVDETEDAGPVVDSHEKVPLRVLWQGKGQLCQDIIQPLVGFVFISLSNLKLGVGCGIGQPVAECETGVQVFIPDERQPAQRKSAIQLAIVLFS